MKIIKLFRKVRVVVDLLCTIAFILRNIVWWRYNIFIHKKYSTFFHYFLYTWNSPVRNNGLHATNLFCRDYFTRKINPVSISRHRLILRQSRVYYAINKFLNRLPTEVRDKQSLSRSSLRLMELLLYFVYNSNDFEIPCNSLRQ